MKFDNATNPDTKSRVRVSKVIFAALSPDSSSGDGAAIGYPIPHSPLHREIPPFPLPSATKMNQSIRKKLQLR
jgi:hypothetical protein